MSPEREPLERDQADGAPEAAAGQAGDPGDGDVGEAGDAGHSNPPLPRREPGARRRRPVTSSPQLSLEQLTELRERLAQLKAEHQPAPPQEQ